ncbi:hypothetical protein J8I87_06225 [Paraburkholderia sp. LEh10]|uniref:hypothetical protein n=1 Tax=Paraburkholderia sp. LEh10 TaxID=2821353 RepID=UPI001AE350D2|nr:hypothetical protein [Paraburkholderia sp. LEh10]MBP0589321.1 hypothetical protein [Paraburkholderia sp. LEh10]
MAQLTSEQLAFLKSQKISLSLLFDATGLSQSQREAVMRQMDKKFYYGGAACQKAGHTLRTKAGHCIQCDTSKIAYQLRSSDPGYVYLAHSKTTGYVKVGFSKEHPQDRSLTLRNEAYGNIKDWDIKKIVRLERNAGRHEFAVHELLESYRAPVVYEKTSGNFVECREIFKCDLAAALATFSSVLDRAS